MCRYRIVQDGLPLLLPYVTRQVLQPTVQEFLHLIEGRSLYVPEEARSVPAATANAAADGTVADGAAAAADQTQQPAHQLVPSTDAAEQEVKAEPENKEATAEGQTPLCLFQEDHCLHMCVLFIRCYVSQAGHWFCVLGPNGRLQALYSVIHASLGSCGFVQVMLQRCRSSVTLQKTLIPWNRSET